MTNKWFIQTSVFGKYFLESSEVSMSLQGKFTAFVGGEGFEQKLEFWKTFIYARIYTYTHYGLDSFPKFF